MKLSRSLVHGCQNVNLGSQHTRRQDCMMCSVLFGLREVFLITQIQLKVGKGKR